MVRLLLFFIVGFLLMNCEKKGVPADFRINYDSLKNMTVSRVREFLPSFDTIRFFAGESEALSSMAGFFFLQGDTIGFADRQLVAILQYDTAGRFIKTELRRGKGPNEVLGMERFVVLPEGGYAVLDGNWFLSFFDRQWKKTGESYLMWYKNKTNRQLDSLRRIKNVNEFAVYNFEYEGGDIKAWREKYMIVPVETEHPNFNAYMEDVAGYYYENAATLGIVERSSGNLCRLLCPRPLIYQKKRFIPNFRHVIFDVCQDTLFFSFQADSLIYKMILPEGQITSVYGVSGRELNADYKTTRTFDEASDRYREDMEMYGRYNSLRYFGETGLLFRIYRRGKEIKTEGVQVYRDNELLYDFDVPEGFKLFAYQSPYYYASIAPDEQKEEMMVLKFRLP